MKKCRFLSTLLTTAALVFTLMPAPAWAAATPEISAQHAILVDANYDEILFERDAHTKAYPASITKVMTALMVCEAIDAGVITAEQVITVSETALQNLHSDGSTANLKAGEEISVKDLLYCLLLPSANEAANILAEAVAGSTETFVTLMNARAQGLGCTGTHFVNAHGLHDDDHYTTAYDIALFTKEALTHSLIREIVSSKTYQVPATNLSDARTFYNTNALISNWHYLGYTYDKAIGVKTGTTDEAGKCLVSAAVNEDDDEYVICVVLEEPYKNEDGTLSLAHFSDSKALLKWGFSNFKRTTISKGDTPVAQVAVTLSQETDAVMVKPVGSLARTVPVDLDLDAIESEITLFQDSIPAPVEEGQVLGAMTLSYQGEIYGTLDLVAVNSVTRSEFLYRKSLVLNFISQPSFKLAVGAVLLAALGVALKLLVFTKRRRPIVRKKKYSGRRR